MTSFSVNGSLLLFSQALNFISSNVFLPIVNSFMGISVCSSIRRDLNMGSIVSALRNLITKAISALSAIFVSYLSLKTAVASSRCSWLAFGQICNQFRCSYYRQFNKRGAFINSKLFKPY